MQIDGARPGEMGAEQSRNHRRRPHAMGNHPVKHRIVGVIGVEMGRIGIARHRRKGLNIVNRQHARHHVGLADLQFIKGDVFDQVLVKQSIHRAGP